MQELIDKLIAKAGLTPEQATNAITTVKDYVKEKFPMLEGAIENMLGSHDAATPAGGDSENIIDSLKDKIGGFFSENK